MADPTWPRFLPAGDSALVVEFGDAIDPEVNRRVHALAERLRSQPFEGLEEAVPTYRSLLVHYDPLILEYGHLLAQVEALIGDIHSISDQTSRLVEIPVYYGEERGPDLESLADKLGLAPEEIIRIHSGAEYSVYMIGFTPGFPYLGGLDKRIAAPRLQTPRTHVPAGSVGIAGKQTGIYPIDSPGGWQIIGFTPLRLFDAGREPPSLLTPGDRVRFVPVSPGENLP